VELLGTLQELQFPFQETNEEVRQFNEQLGNVTNPALSDAVTQVTNFLNKASDLPVVMGGTTPIVKGISDEIAVMLENLTVLQEGWDIDVRLNVTANVDEGAESIVDIVQQGGADITNTSPGNDNSGDTPRRRRRIRFLRQQGRLDEARELERRWGL
jgi:hypothetical protein